MRPTSPLSSAASLLASTVAGARLSVSPYEILTSVLASANELESSRHPLGFLHIELTPLLRYPQRRRVRLHIWSEESRQWMDDLGLVHDHIWHLRSLVLVGGLTDVVLKAEESTIGDYVGSKVTYTDIGETIDRLPGRFVLSEIHRRPVDPLSVYELPAGSLHTTEVRELPSATLVLGEVTERVSAVVYGRDSLDSHGTTSRVPATPRETMSSLQRAISAIP